MVFFFNDTATTEIYTLSLHDALPIFGRACGVNMDNGGVMITEEDIISFVNVGQEEGVIEEDEKEDRKSTRLNSSHANISYAVFCLKKKKQARYATDIL